MSTTTTIRNWLKNNKGLNFGERRFQRIEKHFLITVRIPNKIYWKTNKMYYFVTKILKHNFFYGCL